MQKFFFRLFIAALVVYSVVIGSMMLSFLTESGETTLFGLNYKLYMIPLFLINTMVFVSYIVSIPMTRLSWVILIWSLWVSLVVVGLSKNIAVDFVKVNLWLSSFFAAFIFVKNKEQRIQILVNVFIVIYVISYISFIQGKIIQSRVSSIGIEASSNAIYGLLTVFPWLMMLKKKQYIVLFYILTVVAVIFSNKRGAALITLFTVIPVAQSLLPQKKSKSIFKVLLIVTIVAAIVYYLDTAYLNGRLFLRFSSVSEDGGSGRDEIWRQVIYSFSQSETSSQLFGHGHYSVSLLGESSAAHNDFLEVLYDYGIVGLLVYLVIHICIILRTVQLRRQGSPYYYPYLFLWITFFIMSMVSILIVRQTYLIYLGIFWGAIEGALSSHSRNNIGSSSSNSVENGC